MSIEHGTSTADWNKTPTGRGEILELKKGVENGRFELWEAGIGDIIHVVAGEGSEQYTYDFAIQSAGVEPTAILTQTNPDGTTVYMKDFEVILRGSGSWVGREWPLYKYGQGRAGDGKQILINYGNLNVGGEVVLCDPNTRAPIENQIAVLQPAISSIDVITVQQQETLLP